VVELLPHTHNILGSAPSTVKQTQKTKLKVIHAGCYGLFLQVFMSWKCDYVESVWTSREKSLCCCGGPLL
jgi:hypothetical protein